MWEFSCDFSSVLSNIAMEKKLSRIMAAMALETEVHPHKNSGSLKQMKLRTHYSTDLNKEGK